MTLTTLQKFEKLEDALNSELVERSREINTALIALVGRCHHFQIGSPGTAKSLLVRRLAKRIDFDTMEKPEDALFIWLLTRYTTPEEVFGPPSLAHLKHGEYRRNTAHKMPVSVITFLDEIFKANSSILNALLTILNERQFFNNGDIADVPLSSVFAASNEMPQGDELWALWDRLHFRLEVQPVRDGGSFVKMLNSQMVEHPEPLITWSEIEDAQKQADAVSLPEDIFDGMKQLRDNLSKSGIVVTERRFMESLKIIRATAWLNGRDVADVDDMRPLQHVLWSRPEDAKEVTKLVLELANPIDREAHELLERVEQLDAELKKAIDDADSNTKVLAKHAVEIHGKLQKSFNRVKELTAKCQQSGRKSELLETLRERCKEVAERLATEGFGIPADKTSRMMPQ